MKKPKFLKRKSYLISTFVLGTFGSLILASCEPVATIPSNNPIVAEKEGAELDLSKKIEIPNKDLNQADNVISQDKLSFKQRFLLSNLLNDSSFFYYLHTLVETSKNSLIKNVDIIKKIILEKQAFQTELLKKITTFNEFVLAYANAFEMNEANLKLTKIINALNMLEVEVNKIDSQFKNANESIALVATFAIIKKEVKTLSFIKALSFKEEVAINLFGSYVDDPVYSDVLQLFNNYVYKESDTITKLWNTKSLQIGIDSYEHSTLKSALDDLINGNAWFQSDWISNNNNESQLIKELNDALNISQIKDNEKAAIRMLVKKINNLLPNLKKAYVSFFDLQSNASVLGLTNQLIKIVENMDTQIKTIENFSSIIKTMANIQVMKSLIQKFKDILPTQKTNSTFGVFSAKDPIWLQNVFKAQIDFTNIFNTINKKDFTTFELTNKIEKIIKVHQKIVEGFAGITFWFYYVHSQESLSSNLDKLIALVETSLSLKEESDTNQIIINLAQIYNNGQKNN